LPFLSAAGLFVLQGAEFVAMLLIVVYVGAVAVLFLFVVMMLDVDFAELKGELARFLPLGLLIGLVMLTVLGMSLRAGPPEAPPICARRRSSTIPAEHQRHRRGAV
jgi:NADH-quinone oxidoreductase subunit J